LVLVIPVRLTTSLMMSSLITGIPRLLRIGFLKLLMLREIGWIVNRGINLVIWLHQPKQFALGNL
jgi:hypothetical protein